MFSFLFLFLFHFAHAETGYLLENYFSYTSADIANASLNPDNRVFQLPQNSLAADLRGELKWKSDLSQLVLRPRYTAEYMNISVAGESSVKKESHWDVTDAFGETYLTSELSVTAGLQVYQWGPAELLSPSDPLFHFNSRQRSFGYKEKGKMLLRANYSLSRAQNVVLVVEPVTNNESEWIESERFVPKALVKFEIQNDDGSGNIGLVAGREEHETNFAGTYFTVPIAEGFSFYSDAKSSEREVNFRPVQKGLLTDLEYSSDPKKWPVLSITGLRWEGSFDVRVEYIYDSAGFSKDEMAQAFDSVRNPLNPAYLQNLARFQKPGLELLGQRYLYFSYRVNEPFERKDLNIYLRTLYSLQDYSAQSQIEFDKAASDNLVVYGNLTGSSGKKDDEFKILNDWQSLVGVKWAL
jgi:hypothetical protein